MSDGVGWRYAYGIECGRVEVITQCRMGWDGGTHTVSDGVGWRYAHSVGWGGVEVRIRYRMGWGGGTHTVSDEVGWSGEVRTSEMS